MTLSESMIGGALGLNYAELVPVLINAVKELSNEVSDQASTIETLQERLIEIELRAASGK